MRTQAIECYAAALLAMLLTIGCGSNADKARGAAEKAVAASLKDPDSAKFKDVYVQDAQHEQNELLRFQAVCGVVDGKNSFGAFTGGSRFIVLQAFPKDGSSSSPSTISVKVESADRRPTAASWNKENPETLFESHWNKSCVNAAHPPTYTAMKT